MTLPWGCVKESKTLHCLLFMPNTRERLEASRLTLILCMELHSDVLRSNSKLTKIKGNQREHWEYAGLPMRNYIACSNVPGN